MSRVGVLKKHLWQNAVVQVRFVVGRKPERLLLFKNLTFSFSVLLSWGEQIHGQGRSVHQWSSAAISSVADERCTLWVSERELGKGT